jgi:hypothetical protein
VKSVNAKSGIGSPGTDFDEQVLVGRVLAQDERSCAEVGRLEGHIVIADVEHHAVPDGEHRFSSG